MRRHVMINIVLDVDARCVTRVGREVQACCACFKPTPAVNHVIRKVDPSIVVTHSNLPLVISRVDISMNRKILPHLCIAREVGGFDHVPDKIVAKGDVVNFSPYVKSTITGRDRGNVIEDNVINRGILPIQFEYVGGFEIASGANNTQVMDNNVVCGPGCW